MVRAEFRQRLLKASEGKLVPVDEVKPVDISNPPPLYEIRWIDVAVTDIDSQGSTSFGRVHVRLYHSEPPEAPNHFIGHHAHEKNVELDDVRGAQDAEIQTAIGWYRHGYNERWGIATESSPV